MPKKKRKKKTPTKITKEQLIKFRRKADRELLGNSTSGTGPHITSKDRPRKRMKPQDVENND